jgi:hypothetical protein
MTAALVEVVIVFYDAEDVLRAVVVYVLSLACFCSY